MTHPTHVRLRATTVLALSLLARPRAGQDERASADSGASARTVMLAGVVRDTAGRPLDGAEVRVADRVALSEADGTFLLSVPTRDTVQVLVRRIGYRAANALLAVQSNVRRVELAVKMIPSAVELGTIVIEGRRMDNRLWRTGFYDRQKLGFGHLFGPEQIERHQGELGGLVHQVPSVRVERQSMGEATALVRAGRGYCPMLVFVDGLLIRWADEVGLDRVVKKQDILAVEVYPRAAQVPAAFAGHQVNGIGVGAPSPQSGKGGPRRVDCGVIVIWTKPFESKKR